MTKSADVILADTINALASTMSFQIEKYRYEKNRMPAHKFDPSRFPVKVSGVAVTAAFGTCGIATSTHSTDRTDKARFNRLTVVDFFGPHAARRVKRIPTGRVVGLFVLRLEFKSGAREMTYYAYGEDAADLITATNDACGCLQ